MPVTQDRLTRLREFGLSEYAARAYLALLDLGIAEARDVSSLSKVPQAKIYHVLEQLHEKGLVVVLPEFPKKYAPVPFEEYLDRIYEEHTKAAKTIESEREELAEIFRVMGDTDVGDRGFFTVLRGRRNVLSKVEEMLGSTRRDLLVLGTHGSAGRTAKMLPDMARAKERGISMRFLVPIDPETLKPFEPLTRLAEVRARELGESEQSAKVAIVLSDSRSAFLIHFVPDDGSVTAGKDIGVFTDQEAMVAAIQAIVEPHWSRAVPFDRRREEIETGRAAPFTRILPDEASTWSAFADALARGVRDLRSVDPSPAPMDATRAREVTDRLAAHGGRWRALANLPDVAAVDAQPARADARVEVRHLAPGLASRQWLLDEREAFFFLPSQGPASSLVVHTNDPAVVRTLRDHFEALWESGLPADMRRRELEAFPLLRPGDLGIGLLFQILGDAVIVAEHDGRVLMWNPAATRIFGREPHDALGLRLGEILQGDFQVGRNGEPAPSFHVATEGGDRILEGKALRPDGTSLDVEWTLRSVAASAAGRPLLLAIVRDVTERKLVRDAQARANERIVRIYESMTDAFFALDRAWRIVYRNPVTKRLQGAMGDAQIEGRNAWEAFPDIVGTKFETEFHRAMREMKPVRFEEYYPRMGRWFDVNAYPSDEGLSVYFRDVTRRKKAEEAERMRDEQLHEAERLAHFGSWTWDATADEVRWTDNLCRLFGLEPGKAPGDLQGFLSLVHPDDRDRVRATVEGALARKAGFTMDLRVVRADGALRRFEARGKVASGADGTSTCLVGVARDVTDER